jgi:four helix bundle protein
MESYQELKVWKKAIKLITELYNNKTFPNEEIYVLASQIRSAEVSAPVNMAERCGWDMAKEYIQFLRIARGYLLELGTHLISIKKICNI